MAQVALHELIGPRTPVRAIDSNVAVFSERADAEDILVGRHEIRWDDVGDIEARPAGGRVPQNLWINNNVVRVEEVRVEALRPLRDHLLEVKCSV